MTSPTAIRHIPGLIAVLSLASACEKPAAPLSVDNYSCESVPRPENVALALSAASDEWFQIRESANGVYSITEPFHIQETISHLIVGKDRALLFDTGIGLLPLKPVVERITDLPVTVLNSHTHYDHVGGNWEFDTVLAMDTAFTRSNMAGFNNDIVGGDFVPETFCKGAPADVEPQSFATRAWRASEFVKDGDVIDLGGRSVQILYTPGHTPDSVTLFDREHRLLFTGDTWYDASLWLFAHGTNLDDYDASLGRLLPYESNADYLLGAHNLARVGSGRLEKVQDVLREIREGAHQGEPDDYGRLSFDIEGVKILTSQPALDGTAVGGSPGGSGLESSF